jgi:hypothetical protein
LRHHINISLAEFIKNPRRADSGIMYETPLEHSCDKNNLSPGLKDIDED